MSYEYASDEHFSAPPVWDLFFNKRVEDGWRLVCVVKESKSSFYSYWEKKKE